MIITHELKQAAHSFLCRYPPYKGRQDITVGVDKLFATKNRDKALEEGTMSEFLRWHKQYKKNYGN